MASSQHTDSEDSATSDVGEKRRFPRYDRSLLVNFFGHKSPSARTIDISAKGLRIATSRRLEPGEPVVLELYLEDDDPFPIRLRGECRWSDISDTDDNTAGIDLSLSNTRSLHILLEFLANQEQSVSVA